MTCTYTARNECLPISPCVNGYCKDGFNQYFCICFEGFIGDLCDLPGKPTISGSTPVHITLSLWFTAPPQPSTPVFTQPPTNTRVRLGESATLTCFTTGYPNPTVAWFKNDIVLVGETFPTLYIAEVTPDSRGQYRCSATNNEGSIRSSDVYLTISGKVV